MNTLKIESSFQKTEITNCSHLVKKLKNASQESKRFKLSSLILSKPVSGQAGMLGETELLDIQTGQGGIVYKREANEAVLDVKTSQTNADTGLHAPCSHVRLFYFGQSDKHRCDKAGVQPFESLSSQFLMTRHYNEEDGLQMSHPT